MKLEKTKCKLIKVLSLVMVVMLLIPCFSACGLIEKLFPSEKETPPDEDLIEERIYTFINAYNAGDMEGVMACFDAKTRNAFQALLNLAGGITGGLTGMDIDLADLFTLGVSITSGDFMSVTISSIRITSAKTAVVTATMTLVGGGTQTVYFEMVYENDGWYIKNITDQSAVTLPEDSSNPNVVATNQCESFSGGVASVRYKDGNVEYRAVINTQGKVIYKTDKEQSFTMIGNGVTAIREWSTTDYESYLTTLIDINGNVVYSFDAKMQLIAQGDGLALIYQRQDTISAIKYLYGVIDSTGKWVMPMTDLTMYGGEATYAGDGVFAIIVSGGYYHDDYVFFDSTNQNMFYISNLAECPTFSSGVALVSRTDYSRIMNPFDPTCMDDIAETYLPYMLLLYSNGSYQEYSMDGKNGRGYHGEYLWYMREGDDQTLYIENFAENYTFTYANYSAKQIHSIIFDGDYGLLAILGANNNIYFTLIDKNGNQQFEPIESYGYSNWSHSIAFSDGVAVFQNTDQKYCIVDKSGNVIVTEYTAIGAFSDGMAVACVSSDQYASDARWIYIDKSGKPILQGVDPS